jgi:CheY-like chemotaxis protein/Tfp pilus assembly protein PilF
LLIDIHEMTVLIVDDVVSMTKSLHNMMKVIGYGGDYLFAYTGEEALSLMQEEQVDLVLLDHNLPGMSGAELLSIVRDDRLLRDIPVIMVTAEAYRDYVAEVGESEIDAYILKPITIKLLEERIAQVIDKYNNPPPMVFHLKRAREFEETGDLDNAIVETKLAMKANPNVTRPIRELGYYYYQKRDLKEAEKWLLKAAKLNYLDVFAFHHLGELYLQQNNIKKAAYYFEKAMKISPRHLDRGINFGKTLMQMKMFGEAANVFDMVLELSGSTVELREEIADNCIDSGMNEYAAKLLERIVIEKPNRPDLFFKLGEVLEKIGDIRAAIKYLVNAANLDREDVNTRIHLAKDYLTMKKPMLAEKPLREILKIHPNNELAIELLKQCA